MIRKIKYNLQGKDLKSLPFLLKGILKLSVAGTFLLS